MNFLIKIWKKLLSFIRSFDYFGYSVKLHFGTFLDKEEDGDSNHKTFAGGTISLAVNSIMIYFVFLFMR